jgi:hypothetical protein
LEGALEEGGGVELVGGGLVRDVNDVDGEAAGDAVVGQMIGEVGGVGFGVGAAETVLLGDVAGGFGQGVWGVRNRPLITLRCSSQDEDWQSAGRGCQRSPASSRHALGVGARHCHCPICTQAIEPPIA